MSRGEDTQTHKNLQLTAEEHEQQITLLLSCLQLSTRDEHIKWTCSGHGVDTEWR